MATQGIRGERLATALARSDNDNFFGIIPRRQGLLSVSLAADAPRSGSKPRQGIRYKPRRQKPGLSGVILECLHRFWNE
jgi:hypothetical protein